MARRPNTSVEIFNFSFLDVLACTIGLLLFILVMVFVVQMNPRTVADVQDRIQQKNDNTKQQLQSSVMNAQTLVQTLEQQLADLPSSVDQDLQRRYGELTRQRAELQTKLDKLIAAEQKQQTTDDSAKRDLNELQKETQRLNESLKDARAKQLAAIESTDKAKLQNQGVVRLKGPAGAGNGYSLLHVDCQKERVVLMTMGDDGRLTVIGTTATSDLDDFSTPFARTMSKHRLANRPLVLFWIRPDGMATFGKAKECAPSGLDIGYEPADAQWRFDVVDH